MRLLLSAISSLCLLIAATLPAGAQADAPSDIIVELPAGWTVLVDETGALVDVVATLDGTTPIPDGGGETPAAVRFASNGTETVGVLVVWWTSGADAAAFLDGFDGAATDGVTIKPCPDTAVAAPTALCGTVEGTDAQQVTWQSGDRAVAVMGFGATDATMVDLLARQLRSTPATDQTDTNTAYAAGRLVGVAALLGLLVWLVVWVRRSSQRRKAGRAAARGAVVEQP